MAFRRHKQPVYDDFSYSDPCCDSSYTMTTSGTDTLNMPVLLSSIAVGAVLWVVCYLLYKGFLDHMARVLLIGILFALLCIGVCLTVFVVSNMGGDFKGDVMGNEKATILMLAGGTFLIFGLGVLFQWIYGMNFSNEVNTPTSYIFVIDDSGSMEGNDPENLRFGSILTMMEKMPEDFPYMVYSFTSNAYILRDMSPLRTGDSFTGESDGGTDIKAALERVLQDYENGVWDGGGNPKVLLLSDGESFGFIRSLLNDYAREGISVSTVGFGSVNDRLMQRIANRTGGVYIYVDEISSLSEAIETASASYAKRDLLSSRTDRNLGFVYGLLRVVFLTILGLGIGFLGMVAYGRSDSMGITFVSSGITSFLGSLIMEVGTSIGGSEIIMWMMLWILISSCVGTFKKMYSFDNSFSRDI